MAGNYAALKARLLESDLVGLSHSDAHAALSQPVTRTVPGRYLTRGGVLTVLAAADPSGELFEAAWGWLKAAAATSAIVETAINSLNQAAGGIDFGGTIERAMLDGFVTQGFPAAARDALHAYGEETVTVAETIAGWELPVTLAAVVYSREVFSGGN